MTKLTILVLAAALQLPSSFTPARVTSAPFGGIPYGAAAAGVVALAVTVDAQGAVSGIDTVKDVPPFGDALRSSVASWEFDPAREDGQAVAHPVLVAGLFRPAMVMFPAPPPLPDPPAGAPHSIPIPKQIGIPPYPANRIGSEAVLVEVDIDDSGHVTSAQIVGDETGFDDASLEAARGWVFRPAQHNQRPVPGTAYLLFVYRQPA